MGAENLSQDTLAEQLLELAIKSGAQAAEVYQSRSLSRPVFFEANRLKQLETSQSEGTVLRLWRNGRPGLTVAYGAVPATSDGRTRSGFESTQSTRTDGIRQSLSAILSRFGQGCTH